jgi:polysaccharide export outer membrane protein
MIGCASTGNDLEVGEEIYFEKTTFSFDREKYSFDIFPEYRIVPGDILDVLFQARTWIEKEEFTLAVDHEVEVKFVHNQELNQKQFIRPDGNISLPYIGEIRVVGKSVEELRRDLMDRYRTILKDPELYIVVPEFRSAMKELKRDLHTAPRGLSRLVTVRPDGYVTFPMVGHVLVSNRTITDVNDELNEQYEKIMPGLHVDLFLERHAGSVVYVVGEVKDPGAYKITKPISIIEALAFSKGLLPGANLESVIVVRKHEDKLVATRVNVKNLASRTESERARVFYLQPDDIVWVPRTWISKAAEVARDIADILFFRGWGVGFTWELHDDGSSN